MKNKKVIAWTIIILMVLSIVVIGVNMTPKNVDEGPSVEEMIANLDNYEHSDFVHCLNDLGVKVFISKTCPHCSVQKDYFGDSFWGLNYTDCYYDSDVCKEFGLQGVPAWIINDTLYSGARPLSDLSSITGCSLE